MIDIGGIPRAGFGRPLSLVSFNAFNYPLINYLIIYLIISDRDFGQKGDNMIIVLVPKSLIRLSYIHYSHNHESLAKRIGERISPYKIGSFTKFEE